MCIHATNINLIPHFKYLAIQYYTIMNKKIKLIWEFRGPTAVQTAKHHVIHLKDYIAIEKLSINEAAMETSGEFSASAYMIIEESDMSKVKAALKPHRGQYYNK